MDLEKRACYMQRYFITKAEWMEMGWKIFLHNHAPECVEHVIYPSGPDVRDGTERVPFLFVFVLFSPRFLAVRFVPHFLKNESGKN